MGIVFGVVEMTLWSKGEGKGRGGGDGGGSRVEVDRHRGIAPTVVDIAGDAIDPSLDALGTAEGGEEDLERAQVGKSRAQHTDGHGQARCGRG